MPDELPAENGGAPEATQDSTQADVDWQKRYTDTHAEYNRLNEQFRRFESDEDAVLEFIREKHPQLVHEEDDTEPEPEYEPELDDDELTALRKQVEAQGTWQQQQDQAQAQQQLTNHWAGWEEYVKEQAAEQGVELKSRDIKALRADCVGRDGYPIPPDKAASVLGEYVTEYFPPARPKAPHAAGKGGAVTGGKPWSELTPQERLERQLERAAELEAQT